MNISPSSTSICCFSLLRLSLWSVNQYHLIVAANTKQAAARCCISPPSFSLFFSCSFNAMSAKREFLVLIPSNYLLLLHLVFYGLNCL
ncbi:hypothetical protein BX070DRAFT_72070 [Coemansia spiralis]|nr:hypothetical protein BX070DRAFT_72070 [Coemansia spiralis]